MSLYSLSLMFSPHCPSHLSHSLLCLYILLACWHPSFFCSTHSHQQQLICTSLPPPTRKRLAVQNKTKQQQTARSATSRIHTAEACSTPRPSSPRRVPWQRSGSLPIGSASCPRISSCRPTSTTLLVIITQAINTTTARLHPVLFHAAVNASRSVAGEVASCTLSPEEVGQ